MSDFTDRLVVMAVPNQYRKSRLLPPGLQPPTWEVWCGFTYAVGSLENPEFSVRVPYGFQFDGASVPLFFRLLVPMAHPNYMQATALHDFMLTNGIERLKSDRVFYEALGVLGMAWHWRAAMYCAVRLGGWRRWKARLGFKGDRDAI